jgi:hypothetical protein
MSNHQVRYCEVCQRDCVVCGTCGNPTCNGGYGSVNGAKCQVCPDAYEVELEPIASSDGVRHSCWVCPAEATVNVIVRGSGTGVCAEHVQDAITRADEFLQEALDLLAQDTNDRVI